MNDTRPQGVTNSYIYGENWRKMGTSIFLLAQKCKYVILQ